MAEWFETKVKFLRQMDNGLIKSITEQYLVDSMSFTEAEGRVMTEVGEGMREVTVVSIKRSAIKETVMYGDTDLFFKVKVSYELMDEETEKSKKVNTYLLVNANDAKEAYERTEEHLKEMLVPFSIVSIAESPIIEVYQYQKGLRPGLRRMAKDIASAQFTDGDGNGVQLNGDGSVDRIGGGFDMEEFDAEDWYEGLPNVDLQRELRNAYDQSTATEWLLSYDSSLETNHINAILDFLSENAMQSRSCVYTKWHQVETVKDPEHNPGIINTNRPNAEQIDFNCGDSQSDYPVWLIDQLAQIFGGEKTVGQLSNIVNQYDLREPFDFEVWLEDEHSPTDRQTKDCFKVLNQPRE